MNGELEASDGPFQANEEAESAEEREGKDASDGGGRIRELENCLIDCRKNLSMRQSEAEALRCLAEKYRDDLLFSNENLRRSVDEMVSIREKQAGIRSELERKTYELENIKRTISFRAVHRIRKTWLFGLYMRMKGIDRESGHPVEPESSTCQSGDFARHPPESPQRRDWGSFSEEECAWIDKTRRNPAPLSVNNPHWLGIRSSASQLFRELFFLEDNLDEERGMHYARLFAEARPASLAIQGFPLTYVHLVDGLRKAAPAMPLYIIWHGSFVQSQEDYNWKGYRISIDLCRSGVVRRIGFVKKGMAEVHIAKGIPSGFVMNCVRRIPEKPSSPLAGGPHLGLWSPLDFWRKPPYAMLAAAGTIENSVVHASSFSPRALEFAGLMGVRLADISEKPISQEDMPGILSGMHLNLYVTLSECAPMLPLESLSVGAPCLIGPVSHLFEDDAYLSSMLVVDRPDESWRIRAWALRALEERDSIVEAYRKYAPGYNMRADRSLRDFIEMDA